MNPSAPLEPNALPRAEDDPMAPADFDALVGAARWDRTVAISMPSEGQLSAATPALPRQRARRGHHLAVC